MNRPKVFIITGKQGEGKTTSLKNLVRELKRANVPLVGFTAEGVWENDLRSTFIIHDINSKASKLLCQNTENEYFLRYSRFYFDPQAISFGEQLLESGRENSVKIIDEIGLFELSGNVWAPILKKLLKKDNHIIIITVRDSFVDRVISAFEMQNVEVIPFSIPTGVVAEKVCKQID